MFRTIFGKQLTLYLSVLIVSFVVLGVVLSIFIKNSLMGQRINMLKDIAPQIVTEISSFYTVGQSNLQQIINQYQNVQPYPSIGVVLINQDMTLYTHSIDLTIDENQVFEMPDLYPLREGKEVPAQYGLTGVFSRDYVVLGYPVRNGRGEVVADTLIVSSVSDLSNTIEDIYGRIGLCLLMAIVVGFILIYILSLTISKPLRQMNEVAKKISGGDFDKRVAVKGRDEVSQLADSLNNMAESLDLQETKRREFIANISHDLRSPLTSIRGFIQAIKDGDAPPSKINRYLDIVLDEAGRLSKLTDDIVDLSQIEARQIILEKSVFDINRLIRDTAFSLETQISHKKLNIGLGFADSLNYVNADYDKIRRVIYNLLDNAIKFTSEDGSIIIETSSENGKVWVTVRDNGVGISAEAQKHIFDRFYKADASRGLDKSGNGLGLSIVREFTRVHGYAVTLVSSPGKGSAFTFALDPGEI